MTDIPRKFVVELIAGRASLRDWMQGKCKQPTSDLTPWIAEAEKTLDKMLSEWKP
jgi:hypothetical protein